MKRTIRNAISLLLTAAMILSMGMPTAFAADTTAGKTGLTDCHTAHDSRCGYEETVVEGGCTHIHDNTCSSGGLEAEICTHTHSADCGYSDSITVTSPCSHTCEVCDPGDSESGIDEPKIGEAVQALIDMVDVLPNAIEITEENKEASLADFEAATEAYEALNEDDRAAFEATEQYIKMIELRDVVYGASFMAGRAAPSVHDISKGDLTLTYLKCGNICKGHIVVGTTYDYVIKAEDGEHDVTLRDADIRGSFPRNGECAFTLGKKRIGTDYKATINLTLEGNNRLHSYSTKAVPGGAGLEVGDGSKLVITSRSSGSLHSGGGNSGGAGIGGSRSNDGAADPKVGTIEINGGKITAIGGDNSAGIGGNDCTVIINGGTVVATGGDDVWGYTGGAGIGGHDQSNNVDIDINGGIVTATGGQYGAGIGGGGSSRDPYTNPTRPSNPADVKITGGIITAKSGAFGAGIGLGSTGQNGKVEITGGTVTANGGSYGAGIGAGVDGEKATVIIRGGTVAATGGNYGAGIGGGCTSRSDGMYQGDHGEGNVIEITGGEITAIGAGSSAGIGGGSGGYDSSVVDWENQEYPKSIPGSGGIIKIENAVVTAVGGVNCPAIGGGSNIPSITIPNTGGDTGLSGNVKIMDSAVVYATKGEGATNYIGNGGTKPGVGNVVLDKALIFQDNMGKVYGDIFKMKNDLTVDDGITLEIPSADFIVPNSKTLTVNGTLKNEGTITFEGSGKVAGTGTYEGDGKVWLGAGMVKSPKSPYYDGKPKDITVELLNRVFTPTVDYNVTYDKPDRTNPGDVITPSVTPLSSGKLLGNLVKGASFRILKSGTAFTGGIQTYKGSEMSDTFTYGDTVTVKVTPKATGDNPSLAKERRAAPSANQVALFVGETQITDAKTVTNGEDVSFTVNTSQKENSRHIFQRGLNEITAIYKGDANMADRKEKVQITLNLKPLTATVNSADPSATKVYDGTANFEIVVLNASGIEAGDTDVRILAHLTANSADAGDYTNFTVTQVTLVGEDSSMYILPVDKVTGTVKISPRPIAESGRNDERTIVKGATSFQAPSVVGPDGKEMSGTFEYTYDGTSYTDYKDVGKELAKLDNGESAEVEYTFTIGEGGNYTGTISGKRTVHVVGLTFTSTEGAVIAKANPVYGDSWGDILKRGVRPTAEMSDGTVVDGTFTFAVDGIVVDVDAADKSLIPDAKKYTYQLNFTASDTGTYPSYKDIEVLAGEVTVAKKELQLVWSDTDLTYNGRLQSPKVTLTNVVNNEDVQVLVTGWGEDAGGYTMEVVGLTGTEAGNYTLPAAPTTSFTIKSASPVGEVTVSASDLDKLVSGTTVTADISNVTPMGGTASYQWKKTVGGSTENIVGATARAYMLTASDTMGKIFCEVTFSGNVTGTKESNRLDIEKSLLTGDITVKGMTTLGSKLTVTGPANQGITTADYTIGWYRDNVVIPSETGTTYTLTKYDLGKKIKVVITTTEGSEAFTGSLTSNEISVPPLAPEKPVITGVSGKNVVDISWERPFDNGSPITGYLLDVKQGDSSISGSPFTIGKEATGYQVGNLTAGTTYSFRLSVQSDYYSVASDSITAATLGSSSGGGGGGGGTTTGPIVTKPDSSKSPTEAETKVSATVDDKGNATATVSAEAVNDAIKKAQEAAKKNGTEKNGIAITINVTTGKAASSVATALPKAAVDSLVAAGVTHVKIKSDTADITIDLATLKEIQQTVGDAVTVMAGKVDNSTLSQEAQLIFGNRSVLEFSIVGKNGKAISDFGKGRVIVSIPYTPQQGEAASKLQVIHIDADGKAHPMSDSKYDAATGSMIFTTDHFSLFGVGYRMESITFTDIENHWAKADIEFVSARGLLNGTGNGQFSPNTSMTRGMFVTALGRLAGIDTNSYMSGSFTDVKATDYYAPYVNWAADKNIVKGTSAATFAPNQDITRQEMATMMTNYAVAMGHTMPRTHETADFADRASIGNWAAEAVETMQRAGILQGREANRFDPQGTATRAEVSAMLHRFVIQIK